MATTPNHSPPLTSRAKGRQRYSLSLINILLSILPLSTCWNLWMSSPFVYTKVYQSDHAPSEYMLKSLLCWSVSFMLPLTVSKVVLQKEHDSIHHKWPSYHQRLVHTSISQPSGDIPILTHPPNQVGIYQIPIVYTWLKYYIILPMHSGGTNYIIWSNGIHQMTTIDRDKLLHHESWC